MMLHQSERHGRGALRRLALTAVLFYCLPSLASSRKAPLPDEVLNAKTIYLSNKTGNQSVLDTAYDQFTKWGRFTISQSKEQADLVIVFTHRSGLHEGTTTGFTEMNVYRKNSDEPAFEVTEHYRSKLFGASSTKSCVEEFKKRLEKN